MQRVISCQIASLMLMMTTITAVQAITIQVGRPCLGRLAVEHVQADEDDLAPAGGGFGC